MSNIVTDIKALQEETLLNLIQNQKMKKHQNINVSSLVEESNYFIKINYLIYFNGTIYY